MLQQIEVVSQSVVGGHQPGKRHRLNFAFGSRSVLSLLCAEGVVPLKHLMTVTEGLFDLVVTPLLTEYASDIRIQEINKRLLAFWEMDRVANGHDAGVQRTRSR